jgi:hypothetical protein
LIVRTLRKAAVAALAVSSLSWLPALAATRPTGPVYRQVVPPAAPVTGLARNNDLEPMVAIDGAGTIWGVGGIGQYDARDPRSTGEYLTGADIWRSTDNGRSFQWVAAPFNTVEDLPGLGGFDVDIIVAPERNAQGHYTVYAATGWVPGVALAYSTDGGATWTVRHINNVPLADRPWLTAEGPCGLFVTYKQQPTNDTLVNRFDLCDPTRTAMATALNPVSSTSITLEGTVGLSNRAGKPAIAPVGTPTAGTIYVPMLDCDLPTAEHYVANAQLNNDECTERAGVDLAVSSDGGLTFENRRIAYMGRGRTPLWGVSAAVDAAGTVHVSWFDDIDAFIVTSRDGGTTWSRPTQLNAGLGSAAYPTVTAGRAGQVAVAWYGSSRGGDVNDASPAGMGPAGAKTGATWQLHIARSGDSGRTWRTQAVGRALHRGVVCTWGTNCAGPDRNLFDNFGAAISPRTGRLVVAHMADDLTDTVINRWVVLTVEAA